MPNLKMEWDNKTKTDTVPSPRISRVPLSELCVDPCAHTATKQKKERQPNDCNYFNPRTHIECDKARRRANRRFKRYFNPRIHMECDIENSTFTQATQGFQSTHSHGVRLQCSMYSFSGHNFNPRTHMECDQPYRSQVPTQPIFQSTHPHGVRRILWY